MKYRCDHCDEYHDASGLTINIGDEGHKVIDDIGKAVMGIVEKRAVFIDICTSSSFRTDKTGRTATRK